MGCCGSKDKGEAEGHGPRPVETTDQPVVTDQGIQPTPSTASQPTADNNVGLAITTPQQHAIPEESTFIYGSSFEPQTNPAPAAAAAGSSTAPQVSNEPRGQVEQPEDGPSRRQTGSSTSSSSSPSSSSRVSAGRNAEDGGRKD